MVLGQTMDICFVFVLSSLHLTQLMVSMTRLNALGGEMTENILKSCSDYSHQSWCLAACSVYIGFQFKPTYYHICLCLQTYPVVKKRATLGILQENNILMVIKNDEFENKSVFLDPCSVFSK